MQTFDALFVIVGLFFKDFSMTGFSIQPVIPYTTAFLPYCNYSYLLRQTEFINSVNQLTNKQTRHRASTSMYSLTFRVRVATPAQYGRNGTT